MPRRMNMVSNSDEDRQCLAASTAISQRPDITADATDQQNTRGVVDCERTLLPPACHVSSRKRCGKESYGSAFGEPQGHQRPARVRQFEGSARSAGASFALQ